MNIINININISKNRDMNLKDARGCGRRMLNVCHVSIISYLYIVLLSKRSSIIIDCFFFVVVVVAVI